MTYINFEPTRYDSACCKYFMEKDANGNWYVCQRECFPVGRSFLCSDGRFENDSRNRHVFKSVEEAEKALHLVLNPVFYTRDNTLLDVIYNQTSFDDMQLCAMTLGYPYFLWNDKVYNTKTELLICNYSSPYVKLKSDS